MSNKLFMTAQEVADTLGMSKAYAYKELNERYETLIEEYKISRNINDELKEQDQMKWVQEMNNIKSCVEKIILNEII